MGVIKSYIQNKRREIIEKAYEVNIFLKVFQSDLVRFYETDKSDISRDFTDCEKDLIKLFMRMSNFNRMYSLPIDLSHKAMVNHSAKYMIDTLIQESNRLWIVSSLCWKFSKEEQREIEELYNTIKEIERRKYNEFEVKSKENLRTKGYVHG